MKLMSFMISSLIMSTLLFLSLMKLSKKKQSNKKESSTFECGFQNLSTKNTFYSSQFFMIAILFLIFDMEIAFIIPILISESIDVNLSWNISIILLILLTGTIMEWLLGMIEWNK